MKNKITPLLVSFAGVATAAQAQHGVAPQDQAGARPNILFCIADDASYHHFSANGCSWVNTPAFDRIAREGVLFASCYTPNAKSAPSRACILTGRNSWQLKEAGNHVGNFPAEFTVITEALEGAGYATGYTGKTWAPGNPGMKDGEPRRLTGKPYNDKKLSPPAKFISAVDYAANFSLFLDDAGHEPWFFWYGGQEPHRAYEQGAGQRVGGKSPEMIDRVPTYYPDNEIVRGDMLDYGMESEWFDAQLGKMLDELERRGMLRNTLIVVTSDNGMPFPRGKANDYDYSCHMPLAVMWQEGIRTPGRTETGYVSFVDYAPTFLEAAGVEQERSGMQAITGRSLGDILRDSQSPAEKDSRRSILLGRERDDYGRPDNQGYPMRAIIRDGMLLVLNLKEDRWPAGDPLTGYLDVDGIDGRYKSLDEIEETSYWQLSFGKRPVEELYDLSSDVDCIHNLAALPGYAALKESLREELVARLKEQDDPRMFGRGDVFDNYPFDKPGNENFYERVESGEIAEPWRQTNWINATDYDLYLDKLKKGEVEPYNKVTTAQ